MMGINDLRNKKPSGATFENIKKAIIQIRTKTGAMVQILQIPPHRDPMINKLVTYVNNRLATLQNNDSCIISTEALPDLHETPLSSILSKRDDYHINEDTGKTYMKEIKNHWTKGEDLKEMTTDCYLAGHIIGREGRKIKSIKTESNAEIAVLNTKGQSKITVRGTKKAINKAMKMITETIEIACGEDETLPNRKRERNSRSHERDNPKRQRQSRDRNDRERSNSRYDRDNRNRNKSRDRGDKYNRR